jgi:hypothetical protein
MPAAALPAGEQPSPAEQLVTRLNGAARRFSGR